MKKTRKWANNESAISTGMGTFSYPFRTHTHRKKILFRSQKPTLSPRYHASTLRKVFQRSSRLMCHETAGAAVREGALEGNRRSSTYSEMTQATIVDMISVPRATGGLSIIQTLASITITALRASPRPARKRLELDRRRRARLHVAF